MAGSGLQPSKCSFLGSSPGPAAAPKSGLPEVAVAGRSNVGKSSLINFLLGRKGLARTSSTPGRTQLINFFQVDGRLVLVDLPGYGFARAPLGTVRRWQAGVEAYVRVAPSLRAVVLLLDARREPSRDDRSFIELVLSAQRALLPVVTKIDKVGRGQRVQRIQAIADSLGLRAEEVVSTSARGGLGRSELWKRILDAVQPRNAAAVRRRVRVIAIDGPSGAGKSTVARGLACRLGWNHVDTGAMYRSIGLKADRLGIALDDDALLDRLCLDTQLELRRDEGEVLRILLDGSDVSEAIREHRVSDLASRVSARKPVRAAMARYQREMGLAAPSVLEGRDIGTVVFPDAMLKVFLTASDESRAERRAKELAAKGQVVDRAMVLRDIRQRDTNDSSREHAPLRPADDAVTVDTTGMSADEVVEKLSELAGQRLRELDAG